MEVDVTEKIISDTRHAIVPSHIRSLAPAPTITPAGHKVLQLVHGMRLAFISNPLVYDDAWRAWPKPRGTDTPTSGSPARTETSRSMACLRDLSSFGLGNMRR